jgi:hypothetical protein
MAYGASAPGAAVQFLYRKFIFRIASMHWRSGDFSLCAGRENKKSFMVRMWGEVIQSTPTSFLFSL